MPTLTEIETWIAANVLDTDDWDKSTKKEVAVTQATRNLTQWYPNTTLETPHVALQAIWEVQGLNPALKFQKHGVKSVSGDGEGISYDKRDKVSPEIREILGAPIDEEVRLEGGELL